MKKVLKDFFQTNLHKKIDGIGVFVYNDYNTYDSSDPHIEECFDEFECREVEEAFEELFIKTYIYPNEESFINDLSRLKNSKVFVYSMAQNITGYSRRALIPAICEYYDFCNLSADTYTSVIGVNKRASYTLLSNFSNYFPHTSFISYYNLESINKLLETHKDRIIIKPDCESCCIDVKIFNKIDAGLIFNYCKNMLKKYKYLILQDFIVGREVGITVVKFNNRYISLRPIEIKYRSNKDYLTNLDSRYTNLDFIFTDVPHEVEDIAISIANELDFTSISRFDFRICSDDKFYLFDISPTPTMSKGSSCNLAFIDAVDGDYKSVYQFLVFNTLFKPALDSTEHN